MDCGMGGFMGDTAGFAGAEEEAAWVANWETGWPQRGAKGAKIRGCEQGVWTTKQPSNQEGFNRGLRGLRG